ncbi:glycosyltransferase family 4 protein [Desulfobacter postgatei]|uniref:glycosyltransferase family 4 protein n=1 Tax=Desulfobacter postgatei TaxID=2293 RepID=UPI003C6C077E
MMYNIIKNIDYDQFKISVITLIPEKKNTRIDDFRKLGIEIVQLAEDKCKNLVLLYFSLGKKLKEISPNVLHAHCPRSLILVHFLSRRKYRYKKIYTAHVYPGVQQKALYGPLKGAIITWLWNFFMMRTDLPIACSRSVSQQYKEKHGWEITSIPNGCSMPVWKRTIGEKKEMRKKLGLEDNMFYYIFIGRFSQEKNPEFLIKSFSKINDPLSCLIMLGDGPLFPVLKKYESKTIKLYGFKNNVRDYLIASDYYVSASEAEGLANTLLESMSVGLPMILSDIPSHNEILKSTLNNVGILFSNNDHDSLIEAIEKMRVWDIEETAKNIQSSFGENYTAQRMSELYQKAYNELI